MPYAILKFKLPEEEPEFKDAQNGLTYKLALQEIFEWFRKIEKYGDGHIENSEGLQVTTDLHTFSSIKDNLFRIIEERGIDLWD